MMGFKDDVGWAAARLLCRFTRLYGAQRLGDICIDRIADRWSARGSSAIACRRFGRFPSGC